MLKGYHRIPLNHLKKKKKNLLNVKRLSSDSNGSPEKEEENLLNVKRLSSETTGSPVKQQEKLVKC